MIRSRLAAMEFKVKARPDHLFSATPPVEAVRLLLAHLAGRSTGKEGEDPESIMHVDVSRAYFHAPCTEPTQLSVSTVYF